MCMDGLLASGCRKSPLDFSVSLQTPSVLAHPGGETLEGFF